jgi:PTH1 family peptidyl-tRNA hydrolase
MSTHCFIGLGNPGSEYSGTRHNLGFAIIDELSERLRTPLREGEGDYLIASTRRGESELLLVKPLTYMNNSGFAVVEIKERFHLPLDRLLVVSDDFQLPLGRLRLRMKGSDGGHNGLHSVIYHLQSDEFARLRCGIASERMPARKTLMADFVLEPFAPDERPTVNQMIRRAADACLCVVDKGFAAAMNMYHSQRID